MQVKIGSGKVAEPDFQRNGLPPELPNVPRKIGFDNFVKPDLAWKIFRKLFGNIVKRFRPQAALGTGVSPASAQNVHLRYACVENRPEMDGFFAWNN